MKQIDGGAVSAFAEVFEAEAGVTKATDKVVTLSLDGVENVVVFSVETNKEWSAVFQKRVNERENK